MWKDVKGYEDYFMISSDGRLFSKRTNKELKRHIHKNGYVHVATKIGGRSGKTICFKLHRLVAEMFIPNPNNLPFVNHKDGVKHNNNVSNLEWVNASINTKHAYDLGLIKPIKGFDNSQSKLTKENIEYIKFNYMPYCRLNGARALSRKFNVSKTTILDIINGKRY